MDNKFLQHVLTTEILKFLNKKGINETTTNIHGDRKLKQYMHIVLLPVS